MAHQDSFCSKVAYVTKVPWTATHHNLVLPFVCAPDLLIICVQQQGAVRGCLDRLCTHTHTLQTCLDLIQCRVT